MDKLIPYEKLSKKKRRELNAARRVTWTLSPVTRKSANPKVYNRKAARNWKDDSNSVLFSVPHVIVLRQLSRNSLARGFFLCMEKGMSNYYTLLGFNN